MHCEQFIILFIIRGPGLIVFLGKIKIVIKQADNKLIH
jgi:hypothetical protein